MTADEPSTILVVEDDDATRTFLADNLTADGFDLLVADCARDGLRLLETKFPDLVLVDLGLPDASGFELVRRVRDADGIASRVDPRTPLVVVSGRTSELDRVRGFDRRTAVGRTGVPVPRPLKGPPQGSPRTAGSPAHKPLARPRPRWWGETSETRLRSQPPEVNGQRGARQPRRDSSVGPRWRRTLADRRIAPTRIARWETTKGSTSWQPARP